MGHREIELKLLADDHAMRRLRRLPWLKAMQRGPATTRELRSVYFDTPDRQLSLAGVALRVRSIGRKRLQTVKTAGTALGGAFDRGEWETPISGDIPDATALAATDLADVFTAELVAALEPALTTEFKRSAVTVDFQGAAVEIAFDRGEIVAGDGRLPIGEVELELLSGPRTALYDLAQRLHAAAPLRVGHTNKAERGFRLLDGAPLHPRKWSGSTVNHGMSAAAAFQAIIRGCMDHLAANEECLLATGAAEAVHQIRVALRRLRSAMSLFGTLIAGPDTEALKDELRWLLKQLGPARDTDVFLSEIIDPVLAVFSREPALAALHRAFAEEKAEHYRSAFAALNSPRFTSLLLGLGQWVEGGAWLTADGDHTDALARPIETLANELLERRDRKLNKAGRKLGKLSPEQRHVVRILGKKLRYALEFFAPLYSDKRSRRALEALAELQERLGVLNDIAVAEQRLNLHRDAAGNAHHGWAAGLVVGWHSAQTRKLLKQAEEEWRRWADLPRPWRDG
jgi:inorganic triphosphatase YgiF